MNNLNPKVSIIITTFNRVEILTRRSLPSALGQTYADFECIVVDDCSTDNTAETIQKLNIKGAGINYLKTPKNSGLSIARNLAIKNAKGRYIVFIDDDDEIFLNFLEILVPKLGKLGDNYGAITCARIIAHRFFEEYVCPSVSNSFYTSVSTGWLIKREVYEKIGYYEEGIRSHEDSDFGIRFFQSYKAYIEKEPSKRVYNIYDRPHLSTPSKEKNTSLSFFLNKNMPIFIEKGDKVELSAIYRFAGWNYFLGDDRINGKKYFFMAFRVRPNLRNFLHILLFYFGKKFYALFLFVEGQIGAILRSQYNPKYKNYFIGLPPVKK